jgi:hypothetical protein
MKVNLDFNEKNIQRKIVKRISNAQIALDVQVLKDSNYFCPERDGTLVRSSTIASDLGSGILIWDTEYAKRLYHGIDFNFSTDRNPNAGPQWFEQAKKTKKKEWEKLANDKYSK